MSSKTFYQTLYRRIFWKGTREKQALEQIKGQKGENLAEDCWAKIQKFVESDKQMTICSSYHFQHKTTLHCAKRKAKLLR